MNRSLLVHFIRANSARVLRVLVVLVIGYVLYADLQTFDTSSFVEGGLAGACLVLFVIVGSTLLMRLNNERARRVVKYAGLVLLFLIFGYSFVIRQDSLSFYSELDSASVLLGCIAACMLGLIVLNRSARFLLASSGVAVASGNGFELRPPQTIHAWELYEFVKRNQEHLGKWLTWVDDADFKGVVRRLRIEKQANSNNTSVGAYIFTSGKLAGFVHLSEIDLRHEKAELGFWLGAEFQGQGLATRACSALVQHGFEVLGLNRIQATYTVGNQASCAVLQRLGFVEEGTIRKMLKSHGNFEDKVMCSLLACDWVEAQRVSV